MRPGEPATSVPGAIPWDDPSWERAAAGGSARATYERRLAKHRQTVADRRPRILITGAAIVLFGLFLTGQPSTWPFLGWSLVFLGIATTLGGLFIKPAHVRAWRIGAGGEEQVGRVLAPLEAEGYRILHDRRRPGGRDNIDHIVIGPPGVIVVETKRYDGTVRVRGRDLYLKGRRKTEFIDQVERQIDSLEAALGITDVIGVICVVDGEFPLLRSTSIDGIAIIPPGRLTRNLRAMPDVLDAAEIDRLARYADRTLRSADTTRP